MVLNMITLRPYAASDTTSLAAVYRDAVRTLGPQCYNPQQVAMWTSFPESLGDFQTRLSQGVTLVAIDGDAPVAFGQLHPADHLSLLYCRGSHARRGIASQLYDALEPHAMHGGADHIDTEASHLSRPLFERKGFVVVEEERVERQGVVFERFKMRKTFRP